MSPRQNRRRPTERPLTGPGRMERAEEWPDGAWMVRAITGAGSDKAYRCPGCDQEIPPRTPHMVAWPAAGFGNVDDRRHWHTPCWRSRTRRSPKSPRPPRR